MTKYHFFSHVPPNLAILVPSSMEIFKFNKNKIYPLSDLQISVPDTFRRGKF